MGVVDQTAQESWHVPERGTDQDSASGLTKIQLSDR